MPRKDTLKDRVGDIFFGIIEALKPEPLNSMDISGDSRDAGVRHVEMKIEH
jgi:hypothetical protein